MELTLRAARRETYPPRPLRSNHTETPPAAPSRQFEHSPLEAGKWEGRRSIVRRGSA